MLSIIFMPRTTLNLDAEVLAELKRRAKRQHRPLGEVASEELSRAFESGRDAVTSPLAAWKTYDMGEPAVPLEDKDALWDLLDGIEAEEA